MVAASRSGSTSAVMRLSSPSAATFSSQASRSLELGARALRESSALSATRVDAGCTLTFMSMGGLSLLLLPQSGQDALTSAEGGHGARAIFPTLTQRTGTPLPIYRPV